MTTEAPNVLLDENKNKNYFKDGIIDLLAGTAGIIQFVPNNY